VKATSQPISAACVSSTALSATHSPQNCRAPQAVSQLAIEVPDQGMHLVAYLRDGAPTLDVAIEQSALKPESSSGR